MADCPFRYQGQYEDVETGLYYNRFRYYSPESGTYISQDPIGLEGGANFYSYVPDTNSWIDPFGLNDVATGSGRTHVKYSGIKDGKPYHGYASAPTKDNLSAQAIIKRRYGNNFDDFDVAPEPDYIGKGVDGKQTARGLEQRGFEADGSLKGTSNAQNPVGPNNKNRQNYLDKADAHNKNES
ncbi:RHS repeat-associated core domain-containing protein [Cellulophaga sp. L1A9]|uniref:RHS repeat-associated core domain-containing protein n=1 Tax=Cellulophaga sp. L1A9 TaxID=2686362 RepID=UPI00131D3407|nr:RHS repeat-associated core domain-containing protein [Cellulophaga sp. L1A9]